jgi:hypothetical protein
MPIKIFTPLKRSNSFVNLKDGIPFKIVWDFFANEPGLSSYQLSQIPQDRRENLCQILECFHLKSFPLIRFYRDNKHLSVDTLLGYSPYAIRDLAIYDEENKFLLWTTQQRLTLPNILMQTNYSHLELFCNESGLLYLNRKMQHIADKQTQFQTIAAYNHTQLVEDMEFTLADCLVTSVNEDSVQKRFEQFKAANLNRIITNLTRQQASSSKLTAPAFIQIWRNLMAQDLNRHCVPAKRFTP